MTFNQLVALVALAVGVAGLLSYVALWLGRPTPLLRKLGPMQARWGRTVGTGLHFIAYVVVPLVAAWLFHAADA